MSDDLVRALRDSKGWPTLGHAAADRIQMLEADLAYYKGVHDGIYSTGTHVVVERKLLDECERALDDALIRCVICTERYECVGCCKVKDTLAKLRAAQEKSDE